MHVQHNHRYLIKQLIILCMILNVIKYVNNYVNNNKIILIDIICIIVIKINKLEYMQNI